MSRLGDGDQLAGFAQPTAVKPQLVEHCQWFVSIVINFELKDNLLSSRPCRSSCEPEQRHLADP
jgi:hypothetical protein